MRLKIFLAFTLLGCDDHMFTGGHTTETVVEGVGVEAVQSVLDNACAACHSPGGQGPSVSGDLCTDLVNVPSSQLPSMSYIAPNDPANSYLLLKMRNTAGEAGGVSSVMPPGGAISSDQVQIVEDWINSGASCETAQDANATDVATDIVRDGKTIHDQVCMAACHSTNNISLAEHIPQLFDEELILLIDEGIGSMPPQGLTAQERDDVISYMRGVYGEYEYPVTETETETATTTETESETTTETETDTETATESHPGEAIFAQSCQSCHGAIPYYDYLDLADKVINYDSLGLYGVIRDGTSGGMPGFGSSLNIQELQDVTDYLILLFH